MAEEKDKEQTERKSYYGMPVIPWGVTSFEDLDASREAIAKAENLRGVISDFMGLIENIMASSEVPSKADAIMSLAGGLVDRLAELEVKAQYLDRYTEIEKDFTKATEADFPGGGCTVCGFGVKEAIEVFGHCPFCGAEV